MFTQKKLLTAEEVAEFLTLKPSTIFSWVNQRKIPFIKFGNGKSARVRFNPSILNTWINDLSRMPELKKTFSDSHMFLVGTAKPKSDKDFDQFAKAIRETL